jgi:hypothetical protein
MRQLISPLLAYGVPIKTLLDVLWKPGEITFEDGNLTTTEWKVENQE